MSKKIDFTNAKMIEGIIKSVDAISKTLGPKGSCVAIQNSWGNPDITRDGVTVSKNIAFKDPAMNMSSVSKSCSHKNRRAIRRRNFKLFYPN